MDTVDVLIGACLALAAQILVQLWLVPATEARRRRAERWEATLIDLDGLLTIQIEDAAAAACDRQGAVRLHTWDKEYGSAYHEVENPVSIVTGEPLPASIPLMGPKEQKSNDRAWQASLALWNLVRIDLHKTSTRAAMFRPREVSVAAAAFGQAVDGYIKLVRQITAQDNYLYVSRADFRTGWADEAAARAALAAQIGQLLVGATAIPVWPRRVKRDLGEPIR